MGEEVLKARIRGSGESSVPQSRSPCETPRVYLAVTGGKRILTFWGRFWGTFHNILCLENSLGDTPLVFIALEQQRGCRQAGASSPSLLPARFFGTLCLDPAATRCQCCFTRERARARAWGEKNFSGIWAPRQLLNIALTTPRSCSSLSRAALPRRGAICALLRAGEKGRIPPLFYFCCRGI